jgi:protein tyrosine phosphatase
MLAYSTKDASAVAAASSPAPSPRSRPSPGLESILNEFNALPMSAICHHSHADQFSFALNRENFTKNRYPDVLPFDSTRVALSNGEYINASYVLPGNADDLRYIAAQAPLPNTFNAFWLMVWVCALLCLVLCVVNEWVIILTVA